jgi:formate dehydrogenase major subunit
MKSTHSDRAGSNPAQAKESSSGSRFKLRDWPLLRQIRGEPSESQAARSPRSAALHARVMDADKIGPSICPYCAVGCAQLIYAREGKPIQIEGDPRSPINAGTLCPKGAATLDWLTSPERIDKVLYRAPHAERWEEKPLEWAMDRIAALVKQARDDTFRSSDEAGEPLMHTTAMGSLGGATLDNEENYLIKKLFCGGLGMVWIENQARV